MTSDLTPAVNRALSVARRWAEQLGATEVLPRHLLLGLLAEEEGRAALLVQNLGCDIQTIRQALAGRNATLPYDSATTETLGTVPIGSRSEYLLTVARRLAAELSSERTVASEHLLLAVLLDDGEMSQLLKPLGLDPARLADQVRVPEAAPIILDEPLTLLEPTERIDLARIIDANANRAREALRVVEDYCRFVLDDAFLSGEAKRLRHELVHTLADLSPQLLMEARETVRDVGTRHSTSSEGHRLSLTAVVHANLKRAQEALRTLEEYGKLHGLPLGRALESIRYQCYTLERAILIGTTARQRLADARLYVLVTGAVCAASIEWTIKEAAAGGAQIFQLREKQLSDRDLVERARKVRHWTREAGALFIMNDRPDLARLVEADGVHVGQEELSVKDVRRIAGPDLLIGVSTHDIEQLRRAISDGASYVGIGPVFTSASKNFVDLAGLNFVRQAVTETSLPAFAIGGITPENVGQVVAAGLHRVAVSHAICTAEEPRLVAAAIRQALNTP